jgi:peptide/nickel transport system permease protein
MSEASIKVGKVGARRTRAREAVRLLKSAPPSAWFGMIVIAVYGVLALFAPLIAPYGESQVVGDPYLDSSFTHWVGTDQLGRDMLTRLIYGARNTVGIALMTVLLAFLIGGTFGILSAIFRGWLDQILGRICDVIMSIPPLIFALMLLSIVGTSATNLILIIAVLDSTRVFRLSRSVAMNVSVMDYVEAAKLRGEKTSWIMFKEILPNILPIMVAEFGLRFCFVFLIISSLSFLGLGIQPPSADWGSMVRENATLINMGRLTPLLPAGAIALLTVAVNFVVDWFLHKTSGLRDEK